MRFLGIDYGEKKVGVAASDESGSFAMPLVVLPNIGQEKLAKDILAICQERGVEKVVMGESKNFKGEPNPIMKEIEKFKTLLEKESGLPVVYHPEVFSTQEAMRLGGKTSQTDASAAAIVLQSFIDKVNMIK